MQKWGLLFVFVMLGVVIFPNISGGLGIARAADANVVFSDDFEDGDISDWTVTTTGDAIFDVSTGKDCVAHYKLNDNAASTTVVDSQGYSNGMAQQNTEDINTTGKVNGALTFDGTTDYVDTNDTFESTFQDSFSISMWIKPDDGHPSSSKSLFGLNEVGAGNVITLKIMPNGTFYCYYMSNNNATGARTNDVCLIDGQETWHHIVVVADSTIGGIGGIKIYFDGQEQQLNAVYNGNTSGIVFGDFVSTLNLFVGCESIWPGIPDQYHPGDIDNIMIFNTALSADEVNRLYTIENIQQQLANVTKDIEQYNKNLESQITTKVKSRKLSGNN